MIENKNTSFGTLEQLRQAVANGHTIDRVPRDPYWMDHNLDNRWYWNDDALLLVEEGSAVIEGDEYRKALKAVDKEAVK